MTSEYLQMLVQDVPAEFLQQFFTRFPAAMEEAAARTANDPALDKPEAQWLQPLSRYALVTTQFRRCAQAAGLPVVDVKVEKGSFVYPCVRANRFMLTVASLLDLEELPRPSAYREQLARLNEVLSYPDLLTDPEFYAPEATHYAVVVYTPARHGVEGFAGVGIPDSTYVDWLGGLASAQELSEAYRKRSRTRPAQVPDNAQPKLRRRQKDQGSE